MEWEEMDYAVVALRVWLSRMDGNGMMDRDVFLF